ncbi:hypothetical protein DFJ58DRAFT_648911 [Suillus subalutaceus]|uniref:uncharacterized protein n=1 Tax=Suillus subalutaceus TaxID=48586 RepID=UPI001B862557|nr:uncharacterized protein DFJ58DRAFT_648911 [Suillus subalutaceus]KAG1878095.1 hypothetical protein DFJ58DRAFT_648911 [Suillus subalutaceus]
MISFKHPNLFRPNSPPTSPNPPSRSEPVMVLERTSRPLTKLSFSGFKRTSSSMSVSSPPPAPLVQDGSYLQALGLKLSEAVSKAMVQPTGPVPVGELVGGRRPIPAGRGRALGLLIASELKACQNNPQLHKAILRSLHRPLSVLLSNLSALLLPLLSSPAFLSSPAPTVQAPNPNATQLHALAAAGFAGELLESFDEMSLGLDNDARGDGLKAIREGLVSLIGRVVNPLIAAIQSELVPLLESLENPVAVTVPKTGTKALHPSIVSLQALMPVYARALARYTTTLPSQTTLATFLISIIWRALVAFANRPQVKPSQPTSPLGSPQLTPLSKRQRATSDNTSLVTPSPTRFALKLPPSRPSSPPNISVTPSAAADARALHELMVLLPRPFAECDATRVAREAVDEALSDLTDLATLLENIVNPLFKVGKSRETILEEIERMTADLPTLIVLPVLLRSYSRVTNESPPIPPVSSIINVSEDGYRKNCLSGFGRAEQCSSIVGHSVLDFLHIQGGLQSLVAQWLANRVDVVDH